MPCEIRAASRTTAGSTDQIVSSTRSRSRTAGLAGRLPRPTGTPRSRARRRPATTRGRAGRCGRSGSRSARRRLGRARGSRRRRPSVRGARRARASAPRRRGRSARAGTSRTAPGARRARRTRPRSRARGRSACAWERVGRQVGAAAAQRGEDRLLRRGARRVRAPARSPPSSTGRPRGRGPPADQVDLALVGSGGGRSAAVRARGTRGGSPTSAASPGRRRCGRPPPGSCESVGASAHAAAWRLSRALRSPAARGSWRCPAGSPAPRDLLGGQPAAVGQQDGVALVAGRLVERAEQLRERSRRMTGSAALSWSCGSRGPARRSARPRSRAPIACASGRARASGPHVT